MIPELRKNVEMQIEMLREISSYVQKLDRASSQEKTLLEGAIASLQQGMRLINNTTPMLLEEVSIAAKKLPSSVSGKGVLNEKDAGGKTTKVERVAFSRKDSLANVMLATKDRDLFLRELSINEHFVKRLKKQESVKKEITAEFKASRGYLKFANKIFLDRATVLTKKGYFKELATELKRANMDVLFESYVAMMLFTSLIAFFVGLLLVPLCLLLSVHFEAPFIAFFTGDYLMRLVKIFWIPIALPLITFVLIYTYPSGERKSISKKIDQELPFAVIHMNAIAGAGISPVEIFRIIGLSKEYPVLRKEIRKVLNQINLFGYDLVTALVNSSHTAPSERLGELFSGVATSITSGANLPEFFQKRSETLLVGYRLDREQYTKIAETFMDIYISVVIAAPMIFLLLLIIMSFASSGLGLSATTISFIVVAIVTMLNLFFLMFLHLKQPTY